MASATYSELSPAESLELVANANVLVRAYPECFWFWRPGAEVRDLEDALLVVEHLRKYGNRDAWKDAQELYQCLSQVSKKKS